jgi:hypothetical protein
MDTESTSALHKRGTKMVEHSLTKYASYYMSALTADLRYADVL